MLGFVAFAVLLTALFGGVLVDLAVHAYQHSLHSHILLIPFVSAYLIHLRRDRLPQTLRSCWPAAAVLLLAGFGFLVLVPVLGDGGLSRNDELALQAAACLCMLVAGGFAFFGLRWMRRLAFPVLFLGFMIPLPDRAVNFCEEALVEASADTTHLLFQFSGTPVFRDGRILEIPGMVMEVAQECSGIRSTWVLLITSLLASNLFLRSPWRGAVLVAAVIPLGILRNAVRILVIGLLCVHVGPEMIDHWIHHRGGPVFFAASLVPLLVLAWWLRRGEARGAGAKNGSDVASGCGQDAQVKSPVMEP